MVENIAFMAVGERLTVEFDRSLEGPVTGPGGCVGQGGWAACLTNLWPGTVLQTYNFFPSFQI